MKAEQDGRRWYLPRLKNKSVTRNGQKTYILYLFSSRAGY
ncbi:hypothetical protein HMPREF9069_01609 [Atopobium sp. oral taxon 810 str. F0209]|nr:hypothetical protein HMPREF9069_01609 [Atopobium sp. oral taxon 810 str. F0209]